MACDSKRRILYYEVQIEQGNLLNDTPGNSKVICFCLVGGGGGEAKTRLQSAKHCKIRLPS